MLPKMLNFLKKPVVIKSAYIVFYCATCITFVGYGIKTIPTLAFFATLLFYCVSGTAVFILLNIFFGNKRQIEYMVKEVSKPSLCFNYDVPAVFSGSDIIIPGQPCRFRTNSTMNEPTLVLVSRYANGKIYYYPTYPSPKCEEQNMPICRAVIGTMMCIDVTEVTDNTPVNAAIPADLVIEWISCATDNQAEELSKLNGNDSTQLNVKLGELSGVDVNQILNGITEQRS